MQAKEEEMIASIEALEVEATLRETTIVPELEQKLAILYERHRKAESKIALGINRQTYTRQANNIMEMITDVKEQLRGFE